MVCHLSWPYKVIWSWYHVPLPSLSVDAKDWPHKVTGGCFVPHFPPLLQSWEDGILGIRDHHSQVLTTWPGSMLGSLDRPPGEHLWDEWCLFAPTGPFVPSFWTWMVPKSPESISEAWTTKLRRPLLPGRKERRKEASQLPLSQDLYLFTYCEENDGLQGLCACSDPSNVLWRGSLLSA